LSAVSTYCEDGFSLQAPFDAAIVIATIMRPSLADALRSIFSQSFRGRTQIVIGIDKVVGDRGVLDAALKERPPHQAVTVLDLGYSTARPNGGLHPDPWGGALLTILSYAANSRYVAYLDDDNWLAPRHIETLLTAIAGKDWAFSLRWYVDDATRQRLCVDEWESVGPDRGVYAESFGGFVDNSCLMIHKLACEPALRLWSVPFRLPNGAFAPADRSFFEELRRRPYGATGEATSFYAIQPSDANHADRMILIRERMASANEPRAKA
jgi:hypothetical protein